MGSLLMLLENIEKYFPLYALLFTSTYLPVKPRSHLLPSALFTGKWAVKSPPQRSFSVGNGFKKTLKKGYPSKE